VTGSLRGTGERDRLVEQRLWELARELFMRDPRKLKGQEQLVVAAQVSQNAAATFVGLYEQGLSRLDGEAEEAAVTDPNEEQAAEPEPEPDSQN